MENTESVKNDQKYITRTKIDSDPNTQKALVCVICDVTIIGIERKCCLNKKQILKHKHRLSVGRYIGNFVGPVDPLLAEQYHVDSFPELILSPRHSKKGNRYLAHSCCHFGLCDHNITMITHPSVQWQIALPLAASRTSLKFKTWMVA